MDTIIDEHTLEAYIRSKFDINTSITNLIIIMPKNLDTQQVLDTNSDNFKIVHLDLNNTSTRPTLDISITKYPRTLTPPTKPKYAANYVSPYSKNILMKPRQSPNKLAELQEVINKHIVEYCDIARKLLNANQQQQCFNINKYDWINKHVLSNLSHQFKTPLTGIISGIELLSLQHKQPKPSINGILDYMYQSCIQLSSYISDVIDFFMPHQSNPEPIYREAVDITEIIQFVKETCIFKNDNKMDVRYENQIPMGYFDKDKLITVMMNLVNNSNKFTTRGKILLVLNYENTSMNPHSGRLNCKVLDTGIGIPKSEWERIFEPFYQIADEWLTTQEGLGLGMSITRKLITNMGGSIKVADVPDKYQRRYKTNIEFWIPFDIFYDNIDISDIPIMPKQGIELNSGRGDDGGGGVGNGSPDILMSPTHTSSNDILIIEDNIINANLIKMMIENVAPQTHIKIINDSSLALDEILTNNYRTVFLDLKMPKISGFDILEGLTVRNFWDGQQHSHIIIITALIASEIKKKLAIYPVDVIYKPIKFTDIRDSILTPSR